MPWRVGAIRPDPRHRATLEPIRLSGVPCSNSRCALDAGAGQHPEGIVVRTRDRRTIAKLRDEDRERTLRAKR